MCEQAAEAHKSKGAMQTSRIKRTGSDATQLRKSSVDALLVNSGSAASLQVSSCSRLNVWCITQLPVDVIKAWIIIWQYLLSNSLINQMLLWILSNLPYLIMSLPSTAVFGYIIPSYLYTIFIRSCRLGRHLLGYSSSTACVLFSNHC